jgi:ribosomal protein S13
MLKNSYSSNQNEILFGSLEYSAFFNNSLNLTIRPFFSSYSNFVTHKQNLKPNKLLEAFSFKSKPKIISFFSIFKIIRFNGITSNLYIITDSINLNFKSENNNSLNAMNNTLYNVENTHLTYKSIDFKMVDNLKMFNVEELSSEHISSISLLQFYSRRHGIGLYVSNLVCKHLGISSQFKYSFLPKYEHFIDLNMFFFKRMHMLDTSLSEYILSRHQFLITLNNLKGVRLLNGLPIYGQRTRSNSRTASKFPYKLNFKIYN